LGGVYSGDAGLLAGRGRRLLGFNNDKGSVVLLELVRDMHSSRRWRRSWELVAVTPEPGEQVAKEENKVQKE
jgi:hypothetical protein